MPEKKTSESQLSTQIGDKSALSMVKAPALTSMEVRIAGNQSEMVQVRGEPDS